MTAFLLRGAWVALLSSVLLTADAKELLVGGSGTDLATMRLMARHFSEQHPHVRAKVLPSLGSGGGIKAVAKGRLHLGLSSRPLKPKELKYPISAYLYARTPLVLATQLKNPADKVSSAALFAAMSGDKQYWPDGQLMRLVLRPASDSDSLLLKKTFAEAGETLTKAYRLRGVSVAQSDQDAAKSLETISGSLGVSSLALIRSEQRALKALTLDGVAPTLENLANGRYPMAKDLYLVLPETADPDALLFVHFIASPKGSQVLRETGHLPLAFELD